jgi:hypothetical protein
MAFSSEVDAGSREERASKQKTQPRFWFIRTGSSRRTAIAPNPDDISRSNIAEGNEMYDR